MELIERLVSKETARKYLHFDLNSFVATNPTIKWCPRPGCARAVRLPQVEQVPNVFLGRNTTKMVIFFCLPSTGRQVPVWAAVFKCGGGGGGGGGADAGATPAPVAVARTSHAVDCGAGHFFCWECVGEAHAPVGCDQWLQWQRKVGLSHRFC